MKHIEKGNVAGENRNRSPDVLMAQIDVPIGGRGDGASLPDFPLIDIETQKRLLATAFAQIKREQAEPATDIQDRLLRAAKELVRGRINGIAPQFAPHITTQPARWKMGGDAGARRPMFADLVSPVFHLLRIIALPD